MQRRLPVKVFESGFLSQCFRTGVNHPVSYGRIFGPVGNQAPVHEPAVVAVFVATDDGNVCRRDLFRGDVKSRRVQRQIADKIPANPYVTKFERSCDAATHKLSEMPINMDVYGSQPDRVTKLSVLCRRLISIQGDR
jgi:hypothetical protein